jgi:hypothetical protein
MSPHTLDNADATLIPGQGADMMLTLPNLLKLNCKCCVCVPLQVVRPVDARIHFALNCGAASCPAIKLYSLDTLEEGLTAATEAFCASEVSVDVAARKVRGCHTYSIKL